MSVIAVCSGKGSPGATFVAVNLSNALARDGDEIFLVDLDPAGGDIAAYLGLDPRRGIFPLLRMDSDLPGSSAMLREAEDRAGVLALSGFPEASPGTGPSVLASLVRRARDSERTVVVDLGRITADSALVAREADLVLVVVQPDLVSVLGAERALRCLDAQGVGPAKTAAVITGLERRRPGDLAEVADAVGIKVIGTIPLQRRSARAALIAQKPSRTGKLSKSFGSLAVQVRSQVALRVEQPSLVEVAV